MKLLLLIAALAAAPALADLAPPEPEQPSAEAPPPAPAAVHPEGIEKVPMGRIEGGWGYVYACYGLAVGGSLLYALSLYLRRPGALSK